MPHAIIVSHPLIALAPDPVFHAIDGPAACALHAAHAAAGDPVVWLVMDHIDRAVHVADIVRAADGDVFVFSPHPDRAVALPVSISHPGVILSYLSSDTIDEIHAMLPAGLERLTLPFPGEDTSAPDNPVSEVWF